MRRRPTMRAALLLATVLLAGCYPPGRGGYPGGGGYYPDDGYYGGGGGRPDKNENTIVCASKDGRSETCRTPFRIGRAEVDKRYSDSRCDEGRSWGYNSSSIWVADGCRARFRLYPTHGGGGGGRGDVVRCESQNDKQKRCKVRQRFSRADVYRRLSDAPCIYGRTWGTDGNAIWVSNGCRADFSVY